MNNFLSNVITNCHNMDEQTLNLAKKIAARSNDEDVLEESDGNPRPLKKTHDEKLKAKVQLGFRYFNFK